MATGDVVTIGASGASLENITPDTAGKVLTSNGVGFQPSFQSPGAPVPGSSNVPIVVTSDQTIPTNNGWVVPESLEISAGVILEIEGGARLEITGAVDLSGIVTKVKSLDEQVVSSTVLQNDDELFIVARAYDIWIVEFWLFVISASATPQFIYALSVPSGSIVKAAQDNILFSVASTSGSIDRFSAASSAEPNTYAGSSGSGGFAQLVRFPAIVRVGITAGNIQLQWAQRVSNSNATIVQANSIMNARRIN